MIEYITVVGFVMLFASLAIGLLVIGYAEARKFKRRNQ